MLKYFGTDGFRGEANIGLTVDHAFRIGRFLGYYFGNGKKCSIVIGKDTRLSSYMFEYALSAGLTASGADVYLLHVTTTPSISYVTRTEGFDCGIMVSASHNGYHDNGIKLLNREGEKMENEVLEEAERYLDGEFEIPLATGDRIGKTVDHAAGRNRYIGYLISLASHSFRGVRVGLDCANGSAWMIAKNVFETLGAQVTVIANTPDGMNINRECGSTHIKNLQNLVLENHLDVGFAFDGDADRCIAVDEKGNVVTGDHILYLYACYMKKGGRLEDNTIVTTVMSNFGLYKALEKVGIEYKATRVGDKYVYEEMRRGGYLLGGEQSGHIIFAKYANTGDGILTAIKVMQAMLSQKLPLSKLTEPMTVYPQEIRNLKVKDREAVLASRIVTEAVRREEQELAGSGRVLLRASGTEPVIRVMAEAETKEKCRAAVGRLCDAIEAALSGEEVAP